MTTIVGVDPSISSTGLAVWRDGSISVQTVTSDTKEPWPVRWRQILTGIPRAGLDLRPTTTLFVIEQPPAKFVGANAALPNHGLYGILIYTCWLSHVTYVDIQPTQLKKFATGKGSGAGSNKEAVLLAIERRYGHLTQIKDNNQADAFTLMAMGLHHYGHPLADLPIAHTERLSRINWPEWNGFDGT